MWDEININLTSTKMTNDTNTSVLQWITSTVMNDGMMNANMTLLEDINVTMNSIPSNGLDTKVMNFVLYNLGYYLIFILCALGVLNNVLVMLTMISSVKLCRNSGGILILSLAFVDCSLMFSLAIDWYDFYHKVIINFTYCLVFAYYWHIVRSLSHLIVMLISINRFALVCYPFSHSRFTSKKSAILQLLGLVTFSSVASIYTFYTHDPDAEFCTLNDDTRQIYFIGFSTVDTIFSNILPLLVTFALTFKVLRSLAKHKETLGDAVANSPKQDMERNLTKALVAVNVAFMILTLPHIIGYSAMFIYWWLYGSGSQHYINLTIAWYILYLAENVNYLINFYLYVWYSPMFRKSLSRLLRCKCRVKEGVGSSKPGNSDYAK